MGSTINNDNVTVTFERAEAEKLLTLVAAAWANYGIHGGQTLEDAANKLSIATVSVPLLLPYEYVSDEGPY